MEVLNHGITHKKKTCEKCECEFLYDFVDVKTVREWTNKMEENGCFYYLDYRDYYYVECPECGNRIYVKLPNGSFCYDAMHENEPTDIAGAHK